MNLDDLYALMERFEHSSLTRLELNQEDCALTLEKGGAQAPAPAAAVQQTAAPAAPPAQPGPAPAGRLVKAPLVGVFYASASPEAAPYVQVGDRVKAGDVLCLIEAMKMINEVSAPCAGVIRRVFAENKGLVGYDDPLFEIEEQ